jgi:hypothetical protein
MQTTASSFGMCGSARTAEVQRMHAGLSFQILIVRVTDQPIHKEDAVATLVLRQWLPAMAVAYGGTSTRFTAGVLEVLQRRREIVLATGGAGAHRE